MQFERVTRIRDGVGDVLRQARPRNQSMFRKLKDAYDETIQILKNLCCGRSDDVLRRDYNLPDYSSARTSLATDTRAASGRRSFEPRRDTILRRGSSTRGGRGLHEQGQSSRGNVYSEPTSDTALRRASSTRQDTRPHEQGQSSGANLVTHQGQASEGPLGFDLNEDITLQLGQGPQRSPFGRKMDDSDSESDYVSTDAPLQLGQGPQRSPFGHKMDDTSSESDYVFTDAPFMAPNQFMSQNLQYQSLSLQQGDEGGTSYDQGKGWIDNMFSADQVEYHYSQFRSQPPPTQDTQETPQTPSYDLRTNPRPREQYTFPSDHMPRHKRGRGR